MANDQTVVFPRETRKSEAFGKWLVKNHLESGRTISYQYVPTIWHWIRLTGRGVPGTIKIMTRDEEQINMLAQALLEASFDAKLFE